VNIDKGENLGVRGWEVVGGTSKGKRHGEYSTQGQG
jgi:hypothetical protein